MLAMYYSAVLAGLWALILYSLADIALKKPSELNGGVQTSFVASASGAALLSFLSLFFTARLDMYSVELSIITGILMGSGTMMVLRSLETEQVSDTMALVAISYAIPVIFGAAFLKEQTGAAKWAGIALIFLGSTAVSLKDLRVNIYLLPAVIGNFLWGLQFITLNLAIQGITCFVPVAALSAAVSLIPILTYMLIKKGPALRCSAQAILAGVFLALGLLGALAILSLGETVIGMSIVAAEPALVTLLGVIVFDERVNALQVLGVAMATAGIAIVAA